MTDALSPAGSSTYASNTMSVGDGTWDSTKNTFLLPNLQGYNLATTQYNGMGNRFASLDQYHTLILGHAVLAVITFLFIVPAAILVKRFSTRRYGWGERVHIYLQVITLLLATVIFTLGWFAVGPERSLTNPHHGIGIAIYTLIWVQVFFGVWVRSWKRKHVDKRTSLKQMAHQWLGRATAILAITQVALGLALYGSPTWTFVLYAIWLAFLVMLYFILQYRLNGRPVNEDLLFLRSESGRVIVEKKQSGFMSFLAPVLAGGAAATLLGRDKDRGADIVSENTAYDDPRRGSQRSRSHGARRSRTDVRIDEDHYTTEEKRPEKTGFLTKLGLGAGVLGIGAASKRYYDRRNETRVEEYSAVEPDTPSRRRRSRSRSRNHRQPAGFVEESEVTDSTFDGRRDSSHRGPILPGPGDPVATAAAINAAEARPKTPRPRNKTPVRDTVRASGSRNRQDSYSSYDSVFDAARLKKKRQEEERMKKKKNSSNNNLGETVLGGLGLGWVVNKYRSRKEQKEQDRIGTIRFAEEEEKRRMEEENRRDRVAQIPRRSNGRPPSPRRSTDRRSEVIESNISSELSSSILDPPPTRLTRTQAGLSNLGPGAFSAVSTVPSSHEHIQSVPPPQHQSTIHLTGEQRERLEQQEIDRAQARANHVPVEMHSDSTQEIISPNGVSLHVTQHHDKNRSVTVRRLNDEEAAAARSHRAKRKNSIEDSDGASRSGGRYRRNSLTQPSPRRRSASQRRAERKAEVEVENAMPSYAAGYLPHSGLKEANPSPLEPPRPAFAGRRAKNNGNGGMESDYYGGTPARVPLTSESSGGGSHGTWSAMSPPPVGGVRNSGEDAGDSRRRRRAERAGGSVATNTVNFE